MASSDESVNIQIEDKAFKFIRSRRIKTPMILVNPGTRSGGGGCDSSGGCGESGSSTSSPCVNVMMVDGRKPGKGFVLVDTQAGIPVYLAKPVLCTAGYDNARRSPVTLDFSRRSRDAEKSLVIRN